MQPTPVYENLPLNNDLKTGRRITPWISFMTTTAPRAPRRKRCVSSDPAGRETQHNAISRGIPEQEQRDFRDSSDDCFL